MGRHFARGAAYALAISVMAALPAVVAAQDAPAAATPATPAAAPAEIRLEVLAPGTGPMPADTDVVVIAYEGKLADGTVFDSSERAVLPVAGVIPGFAQGLKRMNKGGRYRLTIPAALAYGAEGAGPVPANADLTFTITLTDVQPASQLNALNGLPSVSVETVRAGTGRSPGERDIVLISYRASLADGTEFDSGRTVALFLGNLIPGFVDGLKQMQAGGRYRLMIPAALGYGERAVGRIPPNSDLVFDVELLRVASMEDIASLLQATPAPQ